MKYTDGNTYFYVRNAQGDIKSIVSSGTVVVEYTYDAWGKLISTTGSMAATLGQDNPFRYRGYYYDEETELYYLNQRYYNPNWGRFINADSLIGVAGKLLSHNLFAYCNNNPVMMSDPSGNYAGMSLTELKKIKTGVHKYTKKFERDYRIKEDKEKKKNREEEKQRRRIHLGEC